jgi:uncharacterized protein (TIGR00290 family)
MNRQGVAKAFACWSGGKESALSLYRIMQNNDIEIVYLLNMISEDGKYSRSHGVRAKLLKLQAKAIGIHIVQKSTTWQDYEEKFKNIVSGFKKENITVGIFGDIDLQEHRDWVERVCKDMDIKPILPLWKEKREELLKEFIRVGFKAVVVATNGEFLGKKWLGMEINKRFVEDLKVLVNIDLCGEKGEYHTFVYNGPLFKKPVGFIAGRSILKNRHWFLELKEKSGG